MFAPCFRPALLAFLAAWPMLAAAAPVNDDIANAIPIATEGTATTVRMADATLSPSDPSCGTTPYQSVWYRYTSPVDQFIQARVSATTGSTALRPRMAVWAGSPGALTPVQCHPDAHEVEFTASAGSTYYVEIYSPAPGGETTLNLNFNPYAYVGAGVPIPPLNDLFWYAEPIPALPWSVDADVGAANGDPQYDPFTPCYPGAGGSTCTPYGDTIWYRFTASTTQELDALFTTPYEAAVVQVITGTLDQPTLVADSRTPGKSKPGATRFTTQPGVTYFIEFGSGYEDIGDLHATLALRPSPPVTTGTVASAKAAKIYHRWVWTDPTYQKETHVVVTVNVSCARPIAKIGASFVVAQGIARGQGRGLVPCSGGTGSANIDTVVSNAFKAGPASVTLSATDYDTNFYQTAGPASVMLRPTLGP